MAENYRYPTEPRVASIAETTDERFIELLNETMGESCYVAVRDGLRNAGIEPEAIVGYHLGSNLNEEYRTRLNRMFLTENAKKMKEFVASVPRSSDSVTDVWIAELAHYHPDINGGSPWSKLMRVWIAGKQLPSSLMRIEAVRDAAENRMVPTLQHP